jgi:hypothetical protein
MSRGTRPKITLTSALTIARVRRAPQPAVPYPERYFDLAIISVIPAVFVRVKYFDRILAPVPDILLELPDIFRELRIIASDPAISQELWLRSRHGTWRFFRIIEGGIIEINRNGHPIDPTPP